MESRQFTTLLGPSGCGKTTVLRMIAGLERPDAGEIWFDDTCVFSAEKGICVPPEKRNLGFVFQDFALWPHMSVYENVAFPLRARGKTRELDEKVKKALEAVKLSGYGERYPEQLSGGQQQRVAFARAIVGEPACILFDEPLSALDAILREEMREEISRLTRKLGVTSVFVTHDQTEAMSMSDRIVVMNRGKIEQIGAPEEIYGKPGTKFVANFIGKSNWLGKDAMFRPEDASLTPIPDSAVYDAKLLGQQFMGGSYELSLNVDGNRWSVTAQEKQRGDSLPVYIKKDRIRTFTTVERA